MKRHFSKEDVQMTSKHMKRCPTPLVTREMQIKLQWDPTMCSLQWNKNVKREGIWMWGWGETGILMHYWWACKMVQPLWETVWQFLKKLKHIFITWLSNSTPGYTPKRNERRDSNRYMHIKFRVALFTKAKREKQPKFPQTDHRQMNRNKMWCTNTHAQWNII